MESLLRPPIAFGHRGARAHAAENTLDSFRLALRLGASGLESDVWRSADGEAVLDHDGVVRRGLLRRRIRDVERAALPAHIPSLAELYAECGTGFELSLDVKDAAAFDAVVATARAAGAEERLWLCHPDWKVVAGWREATSARLVDSTRIRKMQHGPERRGADLQAAGVDAVNLHHSDWTAGLVALFHRFGRFSFAWGVQQPRRLAAVLAMGVDAVYSDHVDRMVEAVAHHTR